MTSNDPHLLALSQIEADKATGRITAEQYEKAKAELTQKHLATTKPWRIGLLVVLLIPLLLIGGCFALVAKGRSSDSSTSGYQTAVRKSCANQVRNQIGQATFRGQSETSTAEPDGSTSYTASGHADIAGQSYTYACSATVSADSDKTMTTRLTSLS